MTTRRHDTAEGSSSGGTGLFRGSPSPEPQDDRMQVDGEGQTAATALADEGTGTTHDNTPGQAPRTDGNLLASLPVYFSTSLPSTSSLQIFQYPTYSRGAPLPVPSSARSRGLREAIRYRPKAKRVEVELPLDLRPAVYNLDKGQEMAKGAGAGGVIGQGQQGKAKREVKREFDADDDRSSSSLRGAPKRLEKTRLESSLIPHQTQYMVGVIRDSECDEASRFLLAHHSPR